MSLTRSRAAPADARRGRQLLDFDVCGNFCGPGWCNGGWHSEWDIDPTHCGPHYGDAQMSLHTGEPSCADACCRAHDICCAPGGDLPPESVNRTRPCNRQIVECLNACSGLDFSCKRGAVGVSADLVWAAMDLVEDWCCGHPCPKPPKPDVAVAIRATSKSSAEGQPVTASISAIQATSKSSAEGQPVTASISAIQATSRSSTEGQALTASVSAIRATSKSSPEGQQVAASVSITTGLALDQAPPAAHAEREVA
jgi:hypothetical protein